MKYDAQIAQIAPQITNAQNILIALPTEVSVDKLASGLALYLSLKTIGKNVSIVSDGTLTVGFSHLFGIGDIKNQIPQSSGGNYTITLGGVVAPDGRIPSLESQGLDWSPAGDNKADLKLVFHVVQGQKFEPTFVTPAYEGAAFDLIITIGVNTWTSLGSIYTNNSQLFNTQVLNIDNQANNTQFGSINLVDQTSSSLSEIIGLILPALQLPFSGDIASNIIAGIEASNGLQTGGAETFEVMATALKNGGQKISSTPNTAPINTSSSVSGQAVPVWAAEPQPQPAVPQQGFNTSPFLNPQHFSVSTQPEPETTVSAQPQPSAEEVPVGEQAQTVTPEADWLTPKIFKSSKIG